MLFSLNRIYWPSLICALVVPAIAWGQSTPGPATATPQAITLVESVTPSFSIEPVVQRLNGRRGEVIPFKFVISSTGKTMNVAVDLVNLRQELNGIILHSEDRPAPADVRMTSETRFTLSPGESREITGELTVPLARTNFLSYGLLVRDSGVVNDQSEGATIENPNTRAAIRFITQYVLRIDVHTGVIGAEGLEEVELHDGSIRSIAGMPVIEAFLNNPTDLAFECSVEAEVAANVNARPKAIQLCLPCREELADAEKYSVRLMPRSRVRVIAPVHELVFPGPQTLKLKVLYSRRELLAREFPLEIIEHQFPAAETKLAFLPQRLALEPAQIELGVLPGMRRSMALRFSNTSELPQKVTVIPVGPDSSKLSNVLLSSETFEIGPGKSKNIRATLSSGVKDDTSLAGKLRVTVGDSENESNTREIPMAIVKQQLPQPKIEITPLQYIPMSDHSVFRVNATNHTNHYVPVHGELSVSVEHGILGKSAAGYGKWLAPGESRALEFVIDKTLPDGDYRIQLAIQTTPEAPPMTQTLDITLPINSSPATEGTGTDLAAG